MLSTIVPIVMKSARRLDLNDRVNSTLMPILIGLCTQPGRADQNLLACPPRTCNA